jgi:hypothetical protein
MTRRHHYIAQLASQINESLKILSRLHANEKHPELCEVISKAQIALQKETIDSLYEYADTSSLL